MSPQIKAYADAVTGNSSTGFQVVAALCFVSVLLLMMLKRTPSTATSTYVPPADLTSSRS